MPSIEKRGVNTWRLIVENGLKADGSRNQEKKSIKITDEALLKTTKKLKAYLDMELASFQRQVESGQYIKPDNKTFKEFTATEWKENYANEKLGAYTRKNYMAIINTHIYPEFGHQQLKNIKPTHIANFMTKLRSPEGRKGAGNKPLATNTILNIYKALKSILDYAKKMRKIPFNPIEDIDRPTPDKAEKRELKNRKKSFTRSESEKIVLALFQEPEIWRWYFIGSLVGGFRRGEHLAMEWPEVDFVKKGFWIEKQITQDEEGKGIEGEVKTEESRGFVPMPIWYMTAMDELHKKWKREKFRMGPAWKGGEKEYVFHSGKGEPYYPTSPTGAWRNILLRHNIPHVKLHGLRHTTAKLLREDGADMKSIQELLRHSRLATTSDIYTEESESNNRETANRMEKLNPRNFARSQSVPNTSK